jgi:NAD(P)-dependent dehydrogenase (short-subunit alcohol dehydrogenase family)
MNRFQGKVALVTGAASKRGMGRAAAIRLAQEGADVAVSDASMFGVRYSDDDKIEKWQGLKSVEAEIKALGRKGLAVEADISSQKKVEEMVARCKAEFGRIDILVNTAGIKGPSNIPVLEVVSEEDWQRVLAINVMGPYFCAKAVAKIMIERGRGGKIINFSSIGGKMAKASLPLVPYTVSKFGVIGLTQVLALELAPYKINVNAICPGSIATEFSGYSRDGATIRSHMREGMTLEEATVVSYTDPKSVSDIPLGRIGQPEDVAGLVAFLASSDSDYMTGQAINFTGGKLMCH